MEIKNGIERKIFDKSDALELVPVMPMLMLTKDMPFDENKFTFDINCMIRNISEMVMGGMYSDEKMVNCMNIWKTNYIEKCEVKKFERLNGVIYVSVLVKGRNVQEWDDVDFEIYEK